MTKRKQYTEEFKREAVRLLVTRGDRPASDVAKGLGVAESMLYQWRKHLADVVEIARKGAVNPRKRNWHGCVARSPCCARSATF